MPFEYNKEYHEAVRRHMAQQEAQKKEDSVAAAAPAAPAAAQTMQASSQAAESGNAAGTLGNGLMAAGAIPSPASPYLMAGGLALNVMGAAETNRRKEEESQRMAYNDRIRQRQEIMSDIAKQGIQ